MVQYLGATAPFAQACSQVLRFGGELHIKGNDFCFYCMFKTIFSGHNKSKRGTTKVRGAQQNWGAVHPNASTWLRAWQERLMTMWF